MSNFKMKNTLCCCFSLPLFIFCIWTIFQFACFLSSQTYLHYPSVIFGGLNHILEDNPWASLLIDSCLLSIFMLQHTLQAKIHFKEALINCGIDVMGRIIYNTTTCLALQLLMIFWQPIQSWPVWEVSTKENNWLWWIFTMVHVMAWATIYTGCLVLDLFELLGVKQVYYALQGWPSPLNQKGRHLLRLYGHMRHPGFTAVTFICFVHPIMQMDRLLLAYVLLIYMIFAFKVDHVDYVYHRKQLRKKKAELQISFSQ